MASGRATAVPQSEFSGPRNRGQIWVQKSSQRYGITNVCKLRNAVSFLHNIWCFRTTESRAVLEVKHLTYLMVIWELIQPCQSSSQWNRKIKQANGVNWRDSNKLESQKNIKSLTQLYSRRLDQNCTVPKCMSFCFGWQLFCCPSISPFIMFFPEIKFQLHGHAYTWDTLRSFGLLANHFGMSNIGCALCQNGWSMIYGFHQISSPPHDHFHSSQNNHNVVGMHVCTYVCTT